MLLLSSVRANASWTLLSVAVTILLGLAIGTILRWPAPQVGLAALAAGIATCLLIFLFAQSTYLVFPQLAPDLSFVQLTKTAHVEQNRVEAIDPYIAQLLLGALLSALLILASATSRHLNPRNKHHPSSTR
jgi:membrane-anchored protein YejM (alkaline phosphatase superfamily)